LLVSKLLGGRWGGQTVRIRLSVLPDSHAVLVLVHRCGVCEMQQLFCEAMTHNQKAIPGNVTSELSCADI